MNIVREMRLFVGVVSLVALGTGCMTSAGGKLDDLNAVAGLCVPNIEQTVGDFTFNLEGGKMVTSNKMGREVNDEILSRWRNWGFISDYTYVPSGQFTGSSDYQVSLGGHQEGKSSVVLQFISGLTLFLVPYYVDTHLNLVYEVTDRRTGKKWRAEASDSFNTTVGLLLFPVAPFTQGGRIKTMDRLAAHLYQKLKDQGAFTEIDVDMPKITP